MLGFFDWELMSHTVKTHWSFCELPPPSDEVCSRRLTCSQLANRSVQVNYTLEVGLDASGSQLPLNINDSTSSDNELPDQALQQTITSSYQTDELALGRQTLCRASQISLSCSAGLLYDWPHMETLPHGYSEIEYQLKIHYYALSIDPQRPHITLDDGSVLRANSTTQECRQWVTNAVNSRLDSYSCQEILYPFERACCPGFFCDVSEPCMEKCTARGAYCPSSDTEKVEDGCPNVIDNDISKLCFIILFFFPFFTHCLCVCTVFQSDRLRWCFL